MTRTKEREMNGKAGRGRERIRPHIIARKVAQRLAVIVKV